MVRSPNGQMSGWSDVQMARRPDGLMFKWSDVQMVRWPEDQMVRCPVGQRSKLVRCPDDQIDVWMVRCPDGQMSRWSDVWMARRPDGQMSKWSDVQMSRWPVVRIDRYLDVFMFIKQILKYWYSLGNRSYPSNDPPVCLLSRTFRKSSERQPKMPTKSKLNLLTYLLYYCWEDGYWSWPQFLIQLQTLFSRRPCWMNKPLSRWNTTTLQYVHYSTQNTQSTHK